MPRLTVPRPSTSDVLLRWLSPPLRDAEDRDV